MVELTLVGTLAVVGVRVTRMPEFKKSTLVPVFFVSAADVAVMVTSRFGKVVGSGTAWGAVKTTVELAELAGMLPVSALQGLAALVVGLPLLSTVVVV